MLNLQLVSSYSLSSLTYVLACIEIGNLRIKNDRFDVNWSYSVLKDVEAVLAGVLIDHSDGDLAPPIQTLDDLHELAGMCLGQERLVTNADCLHKLMGLCILALLNGKLCIRVNLIIKLTSIAAS